MEILLSKLHTPIIPLPIIPLHQGCLLLFFGQSILVHHTNLSGKGVGELLKIGDETKLMEVTKFVPEAKIWWAILVEPDTHINSNKGIESLGEFESEWAKPQQDLKQPTHCTG